MNLRQPILIILIAFAVTSTSSSNAEDLHEHDPVDDHGHANDGSIGGFLFPSMFAFGTFGAFEPGANPEDFATTEHDPLNEAGIQAVEFDLEININDRITGLVAGFVYQDTDHKFTGEFEESFLHYQLDQNLAFGGGQFLNTFGFQNSRHTHEWEFVNQNLVQSRALNEGHLTTHGGEILLNTPKNGGLLTLAGGGVQNHEEDHGHSDEIHGEDHHDEFETHGANLSSYVFSVDYRFQLPQNPAGTVSLSYARGGNQSGGTNDIYGLGYQQIWNPHHDDDEQEFGAGALMLRSEFVGRSAEVFLEDGNDAEFDDYGITASAHYGISDRAVLSLRHDWISKIDLADEGETHRTSPALSYFLGKQKRGMIRFQYDHVNDKQIGSEHVGWLQFRLQMGGSTRSHDH